MVKDVTLYGGKRIMITDSFDNKTEPVFTLKDFYGEREMMLDTCIIIFL